MRSSAFKYFGEECAVGDGVGGAVGINIFDEGLTESDFCDTISSEIKVLPELLRRACPLCIGDALIFLFSIRRRVYTKPPSLR